MIAWIQRIIKYDRFRFRRVSIVMLLISNMSTDESLFQEFSPKVAWNCWNFRFELSRIVISSCFE